jgi:hypothetical protein
MKIKAEHYATLKGMISQYSHENREALLAHKALKLGKDPERRFRWDMFTFARRSGTEKFMIEDIYKYANDTHLDTALKRIVRELDL